MEPELSDVSVEKNGTVHSESKYRARHEDVKTFAMAALIRARTDLEVAQSVSEALTETSLRGVDSHGIRLLVHYVKVVRAGRVNPSPRLVFTPTGPGTGTVDADHGFGQHASFFAIDSAMRLMEQSGVAAVSVTNSSHFGSAGCYVLRAAENGCLALGFCNSDSFVLPHDGLAPFHGTNPIAFAAPVPGEHPFLLDMATSVIPWNRVQDHINEGLQLQPEVAVDATGKLTLDPLESAALLPLGGILYGYKGAGLASMIEVLSAVLTGMPHCSRLPGMGGPDFTSHRRLGHFFIVIDPKRFVSSELYCAAMKAYLGDLRNQPARHGEKVMAPGDREWAVKEERVITGIPVGIQLKSDFDWLADDLGVERLRYL